MRIVLDKFIAQRKDRKPVILQLQKSGGRDYRIRVGTSIVAVFETEKAAREKFNILKKKYEESTNT